MLGLEDFERDYHRRFCAVLVELMGVIDELESHLEDVNPSGVGSLGVEHSVRTGRDAREVMDLMGFLQAGQGLGLRTRRDYRLVVATRNGKSPDYAVRRVGHAVRVRRS